MFDSMAAGGTFGVSKRLGRVRVSNRDDAYAKRRGGLDSLVAGGMFGKAAKRNEYIPLENEEILNPFERNIRYLNTMDLGSSFGKATKRFSLDSLGSGAFGVEKRMNDENREQELRAFQLNLGNKNSNKDRFNTYRNSEKYFNILPSYNQPKYDDETQ